MNALSPQVKERPILFSSSMVLALLAGTKTQTRRILKRVGVYEQAGKVTDLVPLDADGDPCDGDVRCPYGAPGDHLWVRETFAVKYTGLKDVRYRATDSEPYLRWKPSIHMPRWASRITLEVTGVRVERLQAISEDDAKAEGVSSHVLPEEWHAVRQFSDGNPRELMPLERFPGAATIADLNLTDIRHVPARVIRTARQQFEFLWESISGPGEFQKNPWVWVVEFKRVTV